jgi:hypothetical protein
MGCSVSDERVKTIDQLEYIINKLTATASRRTVPLDFRCRTLARQINNAVIGEMWRAVRETANWRSDRLALNLQQAPLTLKAKPSPVTIPLTPLTKGVVS